MATAVWSAATFTPAHTFRAHRIRNTDIETILFEFVVKMKPEKDWKDGTEKPDWQPAAGPTVCSKPVL